MYIPPSFNNLGLMPKVFLKALLIILSSNPIFLSIIVLFIVVSFLIIVLFSIIESLTTAFSSIIAGQLYFTMFITTSSGSRTFNLDVDRNAGSGTVADVYEGGVINPNNIGSVSLTQNTAYRDVLSYVFPSASTPTTFGFVTASSQILFSWKNNPSLSVYAFNSIKVFFFLTRIIAIRSIFFLNVT